MLHKDYWTNAGFNRSNKIVEILQKTTIVADRKQIGAHILDKATESQHFFVLGPYYRSEVLGLVIHVL